MFPSLSPDLAHEIGGLGLNNVTDFALEIVALYLILVAIGRLLKRRFGARLGAVYQLFCVTCAVYLGHVLAAPRLFGAREFGAATALLGAGVFVRLLDQYFWRWHFERKRQIPVPKFVREVSAGVIMIGVAFLVLELDYHALSKVPGLLAGSGIIAVIIGLAMQDALGNIIAGFTLQLSRPFKAGDWLLLDNQHVKAIEINWRSSRFVTNDDVQLDIPNQQIVKQTVVNYHGGGARHAMRLEIGVDYDAPPNKVKEILIQAAAAAGGVIPEPAPTVFLKNFGESAVNYEVRFWLEDHRLLNLAMDAIRTNAWYALRRQNIKIPFPIRTVQLERRSAGTNDSADGDILNTTALLRAQPLFNGVAIDHVREVAAKSPLQRYGIGEAIIREDAEGTSMFVLVQGEVGVMVRSGDQTTRVATLRSGECFGEMSLLSGDKRSATVLAVTDSEVLEITKSSFAQIIEQDSGLLLRLSELLAKRQVQTESILLSTNVKAPHFVLTQEEYRDGFLRKIRSFFEL